MHPATLPIEALMADCQLRFTRRSGPGGQNRNKVETAVVVTHVPSGITAEANERRSQHENRAVALFRLRVNLAITLRAGVNSPVTGQVGSPLWQTRCRGGRIQVNPTHDDFPALLAEALDTTWGAGFDLRVAAETLGCTSSQLVKFLQLEPRALAGVNAERATRGLRKLM
ncbi:MAG: peptide chain release factor-like protein [Planctomycetota bacterium]|nr:peptide chain release factor-like protein [Planctomycetota bacterium]